MSQTKQPRLPTATPARAGTWIAYWNGRYVPDTEIRISPWDRGFILADAAYEVTRTFRHVPFHLDWHLDRLYNSLAHLSLDAGLSRRDMERATLQVLERNRAYLGAHDDVAITHRVTRGEFAGHFASTQGPPTVLILCRPVNFARFARYYEEGLEVAIPSLRAPAAGGLDPRIKSHNRLLYTLATVEVAHRRPDVVPLLLDVNGHVTESAAANIHYVMDGALVTPADEVALEGITRRVLLSVADSAGIPVIRRQVRHDELAAAEEALVTATTFSILPVRKLDGRILPSVPGPLTRRLTAAFSEHAGVDIIAQGRAHLAAS